MNRKDTSHAVRIIAYNRFGHKLAGSATSITFVDMGIKLGYGNVSPPMRHDYKKSLMGRR